MTYVGMYLTNHLLRAPLGVLGTLRQNNHYYCITRWITSWGSPS